MRTAIVFTVTSILLVHSAFYAEEARAAACCPNSGLPSTGSDSTSVSFEVDNTGTGTAIKGLADGTTGSATGVDGISNSPSGDGVSGINNARSGNAVGVYASTLSSTGRAVYGDGNAGTGVEGISEGTNAGVYGYNNSGGYGVYGDNGNSNSNGYAGYFNGRVNITGNLTLGGSCSGATCSSDIRLKKNVQSLTGSLDVLSKLRAVTFEWKSPEEPGHSAGTQYGFIAQEVEKVKPEWVGLDAHGFKTLDNTKFQVMLVDSVRSLKTDNDELRAKTAILEDRLKSLEAGRRPLVSGVSQNGIGIGLAAIACALVFTRRERSRAKG